MVYVISHTGRALMPTKHHGKVKHLLRDGLARVARLNPFTIQLLYENEEFVQPVALGVDAGTGHVGLSATTEKRELFAAEVTLRRDIVDLISTRREARRNRRWRKTRYRPARFDNRRRPEGWIAPSVEQSVESHLALIRLVHSMLPVSRTTIEVGQFDTQLMQTLTFKVKSISKARNLDSGTCESMFFSATTTSVSTVTASRKTISSTCITLNRGRPEVMPRATS